MLAEAASSGAGLGATEAQPEVTEEEANARNQRILFPALLCDLLHFLCASVVARHEAVEEARVNLAECLGRPRSSAPSEADESEKFLPALVAEVLVDEFLLFQELTELVH